MHFESQRAFIVERKGNVLEIKAFAARRGGSPIARNAGKAIA
jgi:hypothetical protein